MPSMAISIVDTARKAFHKLARQEISDIMRTRKEEVETYHD